MNQFKKKYYYLFEFLQISVHSIKEDIITVDTEIFTNTYPDDIPLCLMNDFIDIFKHSFTKIVKS